VSCFFLNITSKSYTIIAEIVDRDLLYRVYGYGGIAIEWAWHITRTEL
jgi:hypothetical protein